MSEQLVLNVGGVNYEGWNKIRVTRALEHGASDFDIEVTEKWADGPSPLPWQIKPFMPCTISAVNGQSKELLLTGYVDEYLPEYDAKSQRVQVKGRSKTSDIVDCMPDVGSGQFTGYTVAQIAQALCKPFGVSVVIGKGANVGVQIPDTTHEKTETAYALIEKLCRLRALLAHDNEYGNLVLATVGSEGAAGSFIEGGENGNILAASGKLSGAQRFSQYVVLAQAGEQWGTDAQTQVLGSAADAGVPRFRRHVEMAENAADTATAGQRAIWRMKRNYGRGTEATFTVPGWRQPNGKLWRVNRTSFANAPRMELNRSLLIGKVEFLLDDEGGERTQVTLQPQEAFTPEPLSVNPGNSDAIWSNSGGGNTSASGSVPFSFGND